MATITECDRCQGRLTGGPGVVVIVQQQRTVVDKTLGPVPTGESKAKPLGIYCERCAEATQDELLALLAKLRQQAPNERFHAAEVHPWPN